jgi:cell shape-determining protein MreC
VKINNYVIKAFKKCTAALIISLIFSFLIPGEKTLYTMLVASYATTENIEMAGDTIISFVDYVAEKVDEMNDDD